MPRSVAFTLLVVLFLSLAATSADAAVGRTEGSANVSQGGVAGYSIPIKVPPGVNGLTPELALTYSHRNTQGNAGVGWSVSGLSEIRRCARSLAQDGVIEGVMLNMSDRFCVDGVQLKVTSGTYGANGSEYRAELDDITRYTAYGTSGDGPSYFKAEAKNGLTYFYGLSTKSRIESLSVGDTSTVLVWALTKIEDRAGNGIYFEYEEDGAPDGAYRIDHIEYGGEYLAGLPQRYKIDFTYGSLLSTDETVYYASGGKVEDLFGLTDIDVEYTGAQPDFLYRHYDLAYESTASNTGRARLESVTECAGSTSNCFAPTEFTYQDGTISLNSEVSSGSTIPSAANALSLDINGDGHMDLAYGGTGGVWRYRLANTTGGFGSEYTSAADTNHAEAVVIDYNADGLEDILYPKSGGTWWVILGTTSGLSGTATNTSAPDESVVGDATAIDMNGDGLDDLVWVKRGGAWQTGKDKLYTRYRDWTGGGFSSTVTTLYSAITNEKFLSSAFRGAYDQDRRAHFDVNGDGIGDIALRTQRQIGFPEPILTFFTEVILGGNKGIQSVEQASTTGLPIDINGDGYTDIAYTAGSAFKFRISNGRNFQTAISGPSASGYNYTHAVALDYDGDGLQDIFVPGISDNKWYWLKSKADSFAAPAATSFSSANLVKAVGIDQNGDGLDDLAFVAGTTGNAVYKTRNHSGEYPDLLKTATDAFGNSVEFSYEAITEDTYTKSGSATYSEQIWIGPMQVVETAELSDGTGGTYTLTYSYESALMNLEGRGLGGFEKRTITDDRTNIKTTETMHREFPYRGRVKDLLVERSNGTDILHKTFTWSAKSGGSGYQAYQHPYVSQLVEKNYEVGGTYNGTLLTTKTTTNTLDAYGTTTSATTTTKEESGSNGLNAGQVFTQTVAHTSIQNITSTWCIGKANQTQWTNSYTPGSFGTQITRTINRSWDTTSNCRLNSQTTEQNSDHEMIQSVGYDSFGNVNSDTLDGKHANLTDMANRVTGTTWDTWGHLPVSVTNAEGHQSSVTWNYKFGKRDTVTDPNNLDTEHSYDDFGRLEKIERPDGTYTEYGLTACNTGNSYCGTSYNKVKTKLRVTETGSNDVAIRYVDYFLDMEDRKIQVESQLLGGSLSRVRYEYDDEGRLEKQYFPTFLSFTGSAGEYANAVYDLVGRVTSISRPIDSTDSTRQSVDIEYLGLKQVTTDAMLKTSTKIHDAFGRVSRSEDDDGYYQDFGFDAFGSLKKVTDSDSKSLFEADYVYGIRAMQTEFTEPNSGTWEYWYNSFGEVEKYQDANFAGTSTYFTATFDKLGRQTQRVDPANTHTSATTTTWTWGDSAVDHNIGKLESVSAGSHTVSYDFDSLGRLETRTTVADTTYFDDYTYSSTTGRLETREFPESVNSVRVKLKYEYGYGFTKKILNHADTNTVYWEATSVDARGNVIDETLENDVQSIRLYDSVTGLIDYIEAGTNGDIQDLEYEWNKVGSLTQREDVNRGLTEVFYYDDLHRLDYSTLDSGSGASTNLDVDYALNGNITKKTDVSASTWTYDSTQIHAVKTAGSNSYSYDDNGNQIKRNSDDVEYYSFNLPHLIENGAGYQQFFYDGHRRCWKEVYNSGSASETTIYVGSDFEKRTEGSNSFYRHQIYADGRLVAIRVRSNMSGVTDETTSVLTDHLGSLVEALDESGNMDYSVSYSAFGERRDPTDWDGPYASEPSLAELTQNGFTDHTHIDSSPLIHMGGRVMDAELGRFMSADPYVPYPDNTQSFNRMSYVRNNPLSRTDPTGFIDIDLGGFNVWIRYTRISERRRYEPPPSGCLTASAIGCYGELQSKSVYDMGLDDWNRFGPNSDLSDSFWGIEIDWGEAAKEGAIIIVPGADIVVCGIRGDCSRSDWIMAIIGVIPAAKVVKVIDKVDDAKAAKAAKAAKTCCFVAGTLVATEDGLIPIEDIEIGDRIWAQDVETGEIALKEVTDLIRRHEREIWLVEFQAEDGTLFEFETTDDHPWWISAEGWVETQELEIGQLTISQDGKVNRISSVRKSDRWDSTFNLTVAEFSTYFVGRHRVLVHNCDPKKKGKWKSPQEWADEDHKVVRDRMRKEQAGYESGRHDQYPAAVRDELRRLADVAEADGALSGYVKRLREIANTYDKRAGAAHRGGRGGG